MLNIRRHLYWVFDLIGMLVAFLCTGLVAPFLQTQLSRGGFLYGNWVETLSPSGSGAPFSPLNQFIWVFALIAPVTVMGIEVLGGPVHLSQQRTFRILLASTVAPLAGVALLSTVFFVLKTPGSSRMFILTFAGASCLVISVS